MPQPLRIFRRRRKLEKSWSPEGGEVPAKSDVPTGVDWSKMNQPFGSVDAATRAPTTQASDAIQTGLMTLGADAYKAGHIAKGVIGAVQASPFSVPGGVADFFYHKGQGDYEAAAVDLFGIVPGAGGGKLAAAARGVSQGYAPSIWETVKDIGTDVASSLDRSATSKAESIKSAGRLDVDVGSSAANQRVASGFDLLKPTPMQRQPAFQETPAAPTVSETAKQYMAER